MFKTNFYTGEMSQEQYTTEAEATHNAGFGQYVAQQQGYIPPATYGLGGNYYQQQAPPQQMYQQYQPYPYMNQPTYGGYNPYQQYQQPNGYGGVRQGFGYADNQQPQQVTEIYIPPVKITENEYLYPEDYEQMSQDMVFRYIQEKEEFEGRKIAEQALARRRNNYGNMMYNNYNYYGNSMFASANYNFHSTVKEEYKEMKEKAKEARTNLTINLLKLVNRTIDNGMSDEEVEQMCRGRHINVQNTIYEFTQEDAHQQYLNSLVPVREQDNPYVKHYIDTKKKIQSILPPDTTMEEFNLRANKLAFEWEMEEVNNNRRSFEQSYDSFAYKRLLREKCAEKAANEKGFSLLRSEEPNIITKIKESISNIESTRSGSMSPEEKLNIMKNNLEALGLPLMSNAAYLDKDGTLCFRANIGNHKGELYTVKNENEAAYANKRAMFAGFLDSIPRSEDLHDEKIDQYNKYSESEFKYNMTHPQPSTGGG